MTKSGMNLQDSFLNQVRKENTEIMLMLLDGTRLNGFVRGFDNFTVIMNVRGAQHLIYKHAIAQIVSRRITHEGEREGGQAGAPQEGGEGQGAPQHEGHPRREREGGHREGGRREGGRHEGGYRDRGGEGGQRQSGPREHAPREGVPRENAPREGAQQRDDSQQNRSKFNTIDFSSIKIDQEKQQG